MLLEIWVAEWLYDCENNCSFVNSGKEEGRDERISLNVKKHECFWLALTEEVVYFKDNYVLEQVAKRGCGSSILEG